MFKKILYTCILLSFSIYSSFACDNSSINSVNAVDNGNGTTTYTINFTLEYGNFDASYYGSVFTFSSSQNATVVQTGFTPTIAPTGGLTETLTGLIGSDINSIANDSDWNVYVNDPSSISYEYYDGAFSNAANDDYTATIVVTVQGCVETITFKAHPNDVKPCVYNFNNGSCAVCDISNLAAGSQGTCDPGTNTYTQDITVTYSNEPSTGTLDVNGQSFAITSSPQTVTLTSLPANGSTVDVIAEFSDDTGCNMTTNALFTAPSSCAPSCSITNLTAGAQSSCDSGTNTYTQEVTVTYSNPPASGTLDVNGQSFPITGSPQTVTLTNLTSDGNSVNVTSTFSVDNSCNTTTNSLFTAPAACNVSCSPNNGTWN